jgi:hypothetical protein
VVGDIADRELDDERRHRADGPLTCQ